MNREKTLVKNTLIYTIGSFSSRLLSFLLLPLYTHFLSTSDYGYVDIIINTVNLFLPIIIFQITDGLYRYLLEATSKDEIENIISNSFQVILRNLLIANIIYIIFINIYEIKYSYLIMLYYNLLIISNTYLQIARGLKKNVLYSLVGIISTGINLISNLLLIIIFNYKVEAILISMILSSISTIIFIEYNIKLLSLIKLKNTDKNLKKQMIKYSLPLIPNLINWWVMNVSDRYFLNTFAGIEANGIYAVSNKFATILLVISGIFTLSWQESAISEFKSEDRNEFYTKMFKYYMIFQFSCLFLLLSLSKIFINYFINDNYHSAYLYLPALYFSAVFSAFSSFYGTGFQSSKETIGAFYSSIIGSIFNILLNIIFIPLIGIHGAALSTMISFGLMWVIRIFQTKKYFNIKLEYKKLAFLCLILIFFTFMYYTSSILVSYVSIGLSILFFIIFNRYLIMQSLKSFTKRINLSIRYK